MELHQCLGWVESQSETPILVVLSALLRNFYWYSSTCRINRGASGKEFVPGRIQL
jgi:hypothetical protein